MIRCRFRDERFEVGRKATRANSPDRSVPLPAILLPQWNRIRATSTPTLFHTLLSLSLLSSSPPIPSSASKYKDSTGCSPTPISHSPVGRVFQLRLHPTPTTPRYPTPPARHTRIDRPCTAGRSVSLLPRSSHPLRPQFVRCPDQRLALTIDAAPPSRRDASPGR